MLTRKEAHQSSNATDALRSSAHPMYYPSTGSGYLHADDEEQALFAQLLALEDDELMGVLMGGLEAEEMEVLVEKIKSFARVRV